MKNTILITYQLNNGDKDYTPLFDAIKNLGNKWWHYIESTWIIVTSNDVDQVVTNLKSFIDDTDRMLVIKVTNQERQGFLPSKGWEWLKNNGLP